MLLWMCQLLKHVQQQQLLGPYTLHNNMNQPCNDSRRLSVEALLPISFIRTFMQVYFLCTYLWDKKPIGLFSQATFALTQKMPLN